jgi:hypothetical protein
VPNQCCTVGGKLVGVVRFGKTAAGDFQQDRPGQNDCQQKNQIPRTENSGAVVLEPPPRALAGRGVKQLIVDS